MATRQKTSRKMSTIKRLYKTKLCLLKNLHNLWIAKTAKKKEELVHNLFLTSFLLLLTPFTLPPTQYPRQHPPTNPFSNPLNLPTCSLTSRFSRSKDCGGSLFKNWQMHFFQLNDILQIMGGENYLVARTSETMLLGKKRQKKSNSDSILALQLPSCLALTLFAL